MPPNPACAPEIRVTPLGEGRISINRLGGEPVHLVDSDIIESPYPLYEQMREVASAFHCDTLFSGSWVFLSQEDVSRLSHNHTELSNRKFRALVDQLDHAQRKQFDPLIQIHSRWMVFYDPPAHTRLRKMMTPGFSPRVIESLAPIVREKASDLMQDLKENRAFDVIAEYAAKIPLLIVAGLMGIRAADLPDFSRWTGDIAAYMGCEQADTAIMQRAQISLLEFEQYFIDVVRDRRQNSRPDDFLSLLLADSSLSDRDLFAQCTLIGFTGNVTTRNLIGNAIHCLLTYRDQRDLLLAKPALALNAIEETLRFQCPVQFLGRLIKKDFTYKGIPLKKDNYVVLMLGAANRDPAQRSHPSQFDITRKPDHVSFGEGVHACIGQGIARMEARIAIEAFFDAWPRAVLDRAHPPQWLKNPGLRGLAVLSAAQN